MAKEIIRIKFHSIVDLITNSSTEIFVISSAYTLKVIEEAVKKFDQKYVNIYLEELDDYELKENIEYLEKRGFKVIPPKDGSAQEIHISAERGTMSNEFKEFITKTFNGEYSDNG